MPLLSKICLKALTFLLSGVITATLLCNSGFAQVYEGQRLVQARLVTPHTGLVPGETHRLALYLRMAPHWHTYWENPGDAGLPTSLKWDLPEGFETTEFEWPYPQKLVGGGDITSYAYEDEVLLFFNLKVPDGFSAEAVTLKAKATWLVCEEICLPGSADLQLTLPIIDALQTDATQEFDQATWNEFERRLPRVWPSDLQANWTKNEGGIQVQFTGVLENSETEFFPRPVEGVVLQPARTVDAQDHTYSIAFNAGPDGPRSLPGVLLVTAPDQPPVAYYVAKSSDKAEAASVPSSSEGAAAEVPAFVGLGGSSATIALWQALLYGIFGGLILNVMPCVLPVISLKIFGFIEQAGESRIRIFRFGLAFVAGIFTWFALMALLATGLSLAGQSLNWGFQLQDPWWVTIFGAVLVLFALNMFGVFEIVLPGKAMNALDSMTKQTGYTGTYLHGILATILGSACTAPFLGASVGFAVSQPPVVIWMIFGSVALGMSLPYLFLSMNPAWIKLLPRPGAWMESVKQFMGFLLLLTVIWLVWILGRQRGPDAVIVALGAYFVLALACWVGAQIGGPTSSNARRAWSSAMTLLIGPAAVALLLYQMAPVVSQGRALSTADESLIEASGEQVSASITKGGLPWEPWSPAVLERYLQESDRVIYVDFTADWCWNCKVNERVVLNTPEIRKLFQENNVVLLQADWTNNDPEITAALRSFQRAGVPLNVVYPADRSRPPILLPETLTTGLVTQGIQEASDDRYALRGVQ